MPECTSLAHHIPPQRTPLAHQSRGRSRNFKRGGGEEVGPANFLQKGRGGGLTTYPGALCIANKQNLLKKGGVRTPSGSAPVLSHTLSTHLAYLCIPLVYYTPSAHLWHITHLAHLCIPLVYYTPLAHPLAYHTSMHLSGILRLVLHVIFLPLHHVLFYK